MVAVAERDTPDDHDMDAVRQAASEAMVVASDHRRIAERRGRRPMSSAGLFEEGHSGVRLLGGAGGLIAGCVRRVGVELQIGCRLDIPPPPSLVRALVRLQPGRMSFGGVSRLVTLKSTSAPASTAGITSCQPRPSHWLDQLRAAPASSIGAAVDMPSESR